MALSLGSAGTGGGPGEPPLPMATSASSHAGNRRSSFGTEGSMGAGARRGSLGLEPGVRKLDSSGESDAAVIVPGVHRLDSPCDSAASAFSLAPPSAPEPPAAASPAPAPAPSGSRSGSQQPRPQSLADLVAAGAAVSPASALPARLAPKRVPSLVFKLSPEDEERERERERERDSTCGSSASGGPDGGSGSNSGSRRRNTLGLPRKNSGILSPATVAKQRALWEERGRRQSEHRLAAIKRRGTLVAPRAEAGPERERDADLAAVGAAANGLGGLLAVPDAGLACHSMPATPRGGAGGEESPCSESSPRSACSMGTL
eukprot:tig00001224_g7637.t1